MGSGLSPYDQAGSIDPLAARLGLNCLPPRNWRESWTEFDRKSYLESEGAMLYGYGDGTFGWFLFNGTGDLCTELSENGDSMEAIETLLSPM